MLQLTKQTTNKNSKDNSMKLNIEKLEARIAPGGCSCDCDHEKAKGNNGFGNGGDDPAPGNSGTNGAPNADQKLADVVR
jgi:hypothetical protein